VMTSDYVNELILSEGNHALTSKAVKAEAIHAEIGSTLGGGDDEVIELDDDETRLESHQWQPLQLLHPHKFPLGPDDCGNNFAAVYINDVATNVAGVGNIHVANDAVVSQTRHCARSTK
jgi:hypothetical protein